MQTGLKGGLLRNSPLSIATQIVMILSFKIQIIMTTNILTNYNDSQPNIAFYIYIWDTQHYNEYYNNIHHSNTDYNGFQNNKKQYIDTQHSNTDQYDIQHNVTMLDDTLIIHNINGIHHCSTGYSITQVSTHNMLFKISITIHTAYCSWSA